MKKHKITHENKLGDYLYTNPHIAYSPNKILKISSSKISMDS